MKAAVSILSIGLCALTGTILWPKPTVKAQLEPGDNWRVCATCPKHFRSTVVWQWNEGDSDSVRATKFVNEAELRGERSEPGQELALC